MLAADKISEKEQRKGDIARLKKEIKKIKMEENYDQNDLAKRLGEIRRLKVDFMTYGKFCDYNNLQDLLKVNYGRDIFHGNWQNTLVLPYKTYPMYQYNKSVKNFQLKT